MRTMIFAFLLSSLFFFSASDSAQQNPLTSDAAVTMTIDGVAWSANSKGMPNAVYDDALLNFSVGGGNREGQTAMIIDVTKVSGPGTWTLNGGDNVAEFVRLLEQTRFKTTSEYTGKLTITAFNSRGAKGTFSFDAQMIGDPSRIIQVRNGKFDVEFYK